MQQVPLWNASIVAEAHQSSWSSALLDNQILASALTGDCRVTRFKPYYGRANGADMAILFRALANNSGLVEVKLQYRSTSDDNWTILYESLQAHPTLTKLDLSHTGSGNGLTDDQKTHRTRMTVQWNTVLHTIILSEGERDEQIYTGSILPYLETNLYRPRILAVKQTTERPFREKVLGRALYCVKSNPSLVWMFLSENVDAFVRSEEEKGNSEVAVSVVAVAEVAGAGAEAGSKRKR
jgi:hypothetical protein